MFGDADGVAAMAGDVSTLAALVAVVDAASARHIYLTLNISTAQSKYEDIYIHVR